jgi:hypothetical protein
MCARGVLKEVCHGHCPTTKQLSQSLADSAGPQHPQAPSRSAVPCMPLSQVRHRILAPGNAGVGTRPKQSVQKLCTHVHPLEELERGVTGRAVVPGIGRHMRLVQCPVLAWCITKADLGAHSEVQKPRYYLLSLCRQGLVQQSAGHAFIVPPHGEGQQHSQMAA